MPQRPTNFRERELEEKLMVGERGRLKGRRWSKCKRERVKSRFNFGQQKGEFGQVRCVAEILFQNWPGCPFLKSARAECWKRPSGWFPRAHFWKSQNPTWGASRVGKEPPNGVLFGRQIARNKSLDWITFRDLRNGELRSSKLDGTQTEVAYIAINARKPKTKLVANVPKCS